MKKNVYFVLFFFLIQYFLNIPSFINSSLYAIDSYLTADLYYTAGLDEALTAVEPGDRIWTNIIVHGHSQDNAGPVPFDVVLAIDMSGSLKDNDPLKKRLDAAAFFLRKCEEINHDNDISIRAGILTFRKQGRLEQGLTDNYDVYWGPDGVINQIENQEYGKATNIADAMADSQEELILQGTNKIQAVILFTDGRPYPGNPPIAPTLEEQEAMIEDPILPEAITHGIRYYTIALDDNPYLKLDDISRVTGGLSESTTDPDSLADFFEAFFDDIVSNLRTEKIILHIYRDTEISRFVPNTIEFPTGRGNITDSQLEAFEIQDQELLELSIGTLMEDDNFTLSYKIDIKECLDIDDPLDFCEITPVKYPASQVYYNYGMQTFPYILEEKKIICKKKPYLDINKEINTELDEVKITIINNYTHHDTESDESRTFTNIRVLEQLSPYFQFRCSSPPRFYPSGLPSLDPNFIAPNRFIPGPLGGDLLYWKITSLGPEEEITLKFKVDFLAWLPRDAGKILPVDMVERDVKQQPYPEETIEPRVYYFFRGQRHFSTIPDRSEEDIFILPAILPDFTEEGGRPNLYIEPSLTVNEFINIPSDQYNLIFNPQTPSTEPWPLSSNIFEYSESADIWIDSAANGLVNNWNNRNTIDPYLENDSYNQATNELMNVLGQGDLFHMSDYNRVFVRIHNTGSPCSDVFVTVSILKQPPLGLKLIKPDWETIGNSSLVQQVNNEELLLLYVEVPPNQISSGKHTETFGTWNNIDYETATIMIEVRKASNEAHYSNNKSTESFLIVP